MYTTLPSFVLGFHGCDQSVADSVVAGRSQLVHSSNDYDWLGNGIYFWENDPHRALEYATMLRDHPRHPNRRITNPAVLGAVIDLGHCLNLMEAATLDLLGSAYETLTVLLGAAGEMLPTNVEGAREGKDLLVRRLDCAVIEFLHKEYGERKFDTVRGLFFEGDDLYPNAGFRARNHIQICVRNPNCIKGYFLPREPDTDYRIP